MNDREWREVFHARCRSKRGISSEQDRELCARAYEEDPERYAAMSEDVFVETAPFGSTVTKGDQP